MLQSNLSSAFTDILVDFATYLADVAAGVTLKHFRQLDAVENKLDDKSFDPVTVADQDAEAAIRKLIEEAYPDHEILGEEMGFKETGSEFRWVLDPIDGTRAFIAGLPTWGTLIALQFKGKPLIGVIDHPALRERYVGTMQSATLNGHPINTKMIGTLSKAHLSSTDPGLFIKPDEATQFERVKSSVRMVRYGFDCYAYARLAAGGFDIVMESGLKPHDLMALIPVIVGAGGLALDWSGNDAGESDQVLAIGDPAIREDVLALIMG